MKRVEKKRRGVILVIMALFVVNMIGINALATDDGSKTSNDRVPDGVLVGYTPAVVKVKIGEHVEVFGPFGGIFSRVVDDYKYILCCKKTFRAMDGCKGLSICPN